MINKIRTLFQAIFELAVIIQFKEQNSYPVDGRGVWKQIEELVEKITQSFGKYTSLDLENFCKKVKAVDDELHLSVDEMNPKSNHFLLQLCNLPYKKSGGEILLNRVMQLALNAGQLYVFYKVGSLNYKIKEVIDPKIFTPEFYLSEQQMTSINEAITDEKFDQLINKLMDLEKELTGDSKYFKKYMKYKLKYLDELQNTKLV